MNEQCVTKPLAMSKEYIRKGKPDSVYKLPRGTILESGDVLVLEGITDKDGTRYTSHEIVRKEKQMKTDLITKFLATEIMGWEYIKLLHRGRWVIKGADGEIAEWVMLAYKFSPLTDISHAFMVVEAMREKGFIFYIQCPERYNNEDYEWVVELYPNILIQESETAPKAISIAAFRALATPEQIKEAGL